MTYREYRKLCKTKEYLTHKSHFFKNYVIFCLVLNAVASALFSIKDITEHHLHGLIAIAITLCFRCIPALIHIPVIITVKKEQLISTFLIHLVLWIEIIFSFVGIHYLDKYFNYEIIGTGWIAYYVMFYAFSMPTHLQWIYPVNITLFSFALIFTEKIGYLPCTGPGLGPVVSTSLFFSIPLIFSLYYFKLIFAKYYEMNKKLENIAKRDSLTGLYNRFILDDLIDDKGLSIYKGSLILIDVDNFKSFNTLEGHELGDTILKETADIIKSVIESTDFAIRYGGDEFLIFLKDNLSPESFYNQFLKIRSKNIKKYKVTYSFGASLIEEGEDLFAGINLADKAMYKIKDSTKNGFFLNDSEDE